MKNQKNKMATSATSLEAIGIRLAKIREMLGVETQDEMARRIGAMRAQYNNWERGSARIPVQFALKVLATSGAGLDYIYWGGTSALPFRIMTLLQESPLDEHAAAEILALAPPESLAPEKSQSSARPRKKPRTAKASRRS